MLDTTNNAASWLTQHKLPSWRIESKEGAVIADYDESNDLAASLEYFETSLELIPPNSYKLKGKKTVEAGWNAARLFPFVKGTTNQPGATHQTAVPNLGDIYNKAYEDAKFRLEHERNTKRLDVVETLLVGIEKTLGELKKRFDDDDDDNDPQPGEAMDKIFDVVTKGARTFSELRRGA